MSFDVAPQQDLYTKQGVAVTVEAVAQIKVKSDPESIQTAAEQFLTKTPAAARGADPARDGRSPARHHRPAHGRGDRQAAGDGGRPDALDLRRRHEQDGPRGRSRSRSRRSATRTTTSRTWAGPTWRASSATPTSRRPRRSATPRSSARRRSARRPSPRRRPTRSACSPRRSRRPSRPRRSATSRSRRRSTSRSVKKQQAQADKAYEIQTNVMQQQVVAEAVTRAAGREASSRSRCRRPRSCAARRS